MCEWIGPGATRGKWIGRGGKGGAAGARPVVRASRKRMSAACVCLSHFTKRIVLMASSARSGPYPPLGAARCGLALDSLLSPCAPLLPVPPGGLARHCVPRPSAAWHSLPDTMQQPPLHACASELRAAAGQGPCGPGLQRPSPPC